MAATIAATVAAGPSACAGRGTPTAVRRALSSLAIQSDGIADDLLGHQVVAVVQLFHPQPRVLRRGVSPSPTRYWVTPQNRRRLSSSSNSCRESCWPPCQASDTGEGGSSARSKKGLKVCQRMLPPLYTLKRALALRDFQSLKLCRVPEVV